MIINRNSLGSYDGRNGRKAYIAYKGKVYDVSTLFVDGEHKGCLAGNDLTDVLEMMPHGDQVVSRFPIVGDTD